MSYRLSFDCDMVWSSMGFLLFEYTVLLLSVIPRFCMVFLCLSMVSYDVPLFYEIAFHFKSGSKLGPPISLPQRCRPRRLDRSLVHHHRGAKEPNGTMLPAYLANHTLPTVQADRRDDVCLGGRCSMATTPA